MRLRNNIFAEAFDFLKREKGIKTQKQLAQLMGVSEDTITRILKDRCDVTEDIITKLQTASGCIFNLQWLRGKDLIYMLAKDVPEYVPEQQAVSLPDASSMVNALISAKDDAIAALKRELSTEEEMLKTRDDQIASLNLLIAEKNAHIETLQHRCAELRRIIDEHKIGLDHLPFTHGVAEPSSPKK